MARPRMAEGRGSGHGHAKNAEELAERLMRRDVSLWPEGSEAKDRLGWLDVVRRMQDEADELRNWAATIDASKIVLLGMGGSSLGPEVLRSAHRSDRLFVLDTTDPQTVASVDPTDAFFLVSSKSGTTLEPNALFAYFWDKVKDGSHFAAITDPGTKMVEVAKQHEFSRIFENPADIGGRYSVLSYFRVGAAAPLGVGVCEGGQRGP